MAKSILLAVYLAATSLADNWASGKLKKRIAQGKEDPERIDERFGRPALPRPDGPLAWFHAASVGESLSVLELISKIQKEYPSFTVLVTTGTRSSAHILRTRLPAGIIHQYIPVDTKTAVTGFLDHWRPDVAIWTESEFWPQLMVQTNRRNIPMLLINGRISEKSADSWRWAKGMSRRLLSFFSLLQVQTKEVADSFVKIGAPIDRISITGSLKAGAVALPHDANERKTLQKMIGTRPVWFAGSTHIGEEEIVAEAQKTLRKRRPELLLVLAPRHPERLAEIAAILNENDLKFAVRSEGETITQQTEVYVADTFGEMGLWYRIAPVSFVGGSLTDVGGHNPFEPAALGSAILHGPHVENFADIYKRLSDGKASHLIKTPGELADAVDTYLQPDQAAALATAAWEVSSEGSGVTDKVLVELRPYFDKVVSK